MFLNEHVGTHLIGQKVEESKNRVNIGDDGYLIEIDTNAHGRIDEEDVYFKSSQMQFGLKTMCLILKSQS